MPGWIERNAAGCSIWEIELLADFNLYSLRSGIREFGKALA
jgi:hypothetical protein